MNRAALVVLCACGSTRVPSPSPARCPDAAAIVSVSSQDEVAALASCTRVGGLVIRTAAPLDLAPLQALAEVAGDVVIGPTVGVEAIHLDGLRTVDGEVRIVSNSLLHGVYLPALERAGAVTIEGNLGLAAVTAPRLATIGGALSIRDNHDLAFVGLAALAAVKSVQIDGCPELPEDVISDVRARSQAP